MSKVVLGYRLTTSDVAAIAAGATVQLAPQLVGGLQADPTGEVLGKKWGWLIGGEPPSNSEERVRRFILGHCAGVGEPLPEAWTRAMIAVRIHTLAKGYSGVRVELLEDMLRLLEPGQVPVVPSQGSLGAAGSPAMAEVTRVLCGWGGSVWKDGVAVASSGLDVELTEREALALLNGDPLATALGALAEQSSTRLLHTAVVAAAMSFEVSRADPACLNASALQLRGFPGVERVGEWIRRHIQGSTLCTEGPADPFSIRCTPVVLGSAWEVLDRTRSIFSAELEAICDNPVWVDDEWIEAGFFHSAPVASALDMIKIPMIQVAAIAERRIFRLTYGQLSGLPSFLVPSTGLNSGLMLAQYTAASLVSEARGWSMPASVDTIPAVQHREDHVSMGSIAGRRTMQVLEAVADVLAIELLCAAQGLELWMEQGFQPGVGSRRTWQAVRELVPRWTTDRVLFPDLHVLGVAVRQGVFPLAIGRDHESAR